MPLLRHTPRLLALLTLLLLPLLCTHLVAQDRDEDERGEEENPKARENYFYGMRSYPFGKIPQGARQRAMEYTRTWMHTFRPASSDARSLASAAQWRQIGPTNVGGRVRSIVVHPTDPNTLWVGAADGGVWKSTNGGSSWTPIMDNENAIAMGALALDLNNTQVLYAATGEMSSNIDAYTGAGIFKTTDGGATWQGAGLTNVGAFSRIWVHPLNSNLLFAGATKNNSGFYRSADGGATWTRTFSTAAVSDVTIDPSNPNRVWIGTIGQGIFRSTDGGVNFTAINNGISSSNLGRASVQSSASSPNLLYTLIQETSGDQDIARIYKSINGGDSWTRVYNNAPYTLFCSFGGCQGWYDNAIGVSPTDPNLVIAQGIGMVRSANGGTSWTAQDTYNGFPMHPDIHCLAFAPSNPNRLYVGNDGGVYRSDDGGQSYEEVSNGLAITQFYAMAVDQRAANLTYGGTQDNGTIGTDGRGVLGGDGFYTIVDPTNSNVLYAENFNGLSIYRIENGSTISITDGLDPNDAGGWSSPLVLDPTDPNKLFHGRSGIYVTFNRGDTWQETNAARFGGKTSAIGISPVDGQTVYAGSSTGELRVSTDGGQTWTDRSRAPGMPNRAITDVAPSLTDPATAYMCVSGFFSEHVFKTTDHGATWVSIGAALPDIPFNALAIDTSGPGQALYAGSDVGMYISLDDGASWAVYNDGLPRSAVADLEIHRASSSLRMASHGRSMWEVSLAEPSIVRSVVSPAGGELWMGGSAQTLSWNGFTGPVRIEVSLNNGGSWLPVGKNVTGNVYRWVVWDTTAEYAVVRVSEMSNASANAVSRTFSIVPFRRGGLLGGSRTPGTPYGIAYDGEYLWATDFGSNILQKIDPTTLKTVGTVTMSLTEGDSLFTDLAYVPSRGTFFIHKLRNTTGSLGGWLYEVRKDGSQVGRWLSPATYPIGVAWLGQSSPNYPYLVVTDRNDAETIYFFDIDAFDPSSSTADPVASFPRARTVENGPRGATHAPGGTDAFYQAYTEFNGTSLTRAFVEKLHPETQNLICDFTVNDPDGSYANLRGIELDPRDSNLWVSSYEGDIYKIASCDGRPPVIPPPDTVTIGVGRGALPAGLTLGTVTPSPFSGTATVALTVPARTTLRLELVNMAGRPVALLHNGPLDEGAHQIQVVPPTSMASGVYRLVLTTSSGAALSRSVVYVR